MEVSTFRTRSEPRFNRSWRTLSKGCPNCSYLLRQRNWTANSTEYNLKHPNFYKLNTLPGRLTGCYWCIISNKQETFYPRNKNLKRSINPIGPSHGLLTHASSTPRALRGLNIVQISTNWFCSGPQSAPHCVKDQRQAHSVGTGESLVICAIFKMSWTIRMWTITQVYGSLGECTKRRSFLVSLHLLGDFKCWVSFFPGRELWLRVS